MMRKIKTLVFIGCTVVGTFLGFYEYAKEYEKKYGKKK